MKYWPFYLFALLISSHTFASDEQGLHVSGFSRLILGYLDESEATYEGYGNKVSASQQSLLGIQAEYNATDKLTFVAQGLWHTSDERDSGLEWLYSSFRPNKQWHFKLGKMRTPFYAYSDVIDVGFAYPWISPPQQVYSAYAFPDYTGGSLTYLSSYKSIDFDVEGYWGTFEDEVLIGGVLLPTKVNNLVGLVGNLNKGNLRARAAYHQGDTKVSIPLLEGFIKQLSTIGFQESADSLKVADIARAYQASLTYETLDYYASVEFVHTSSGVLIVPDVFSYYATLAYNLYPLSFNITFASFDAEYDEPLNEIPIGVDPRLDQLAFGYQTVFNSLARDNLDSVTLGLRWDLKTDLAFKASYSILEGDEGERSFFIVDANSQFNRKANLYQVALEWVF